MLVWLQELSGSFSPLRIFRSITFRAMAAAGTAFVLSLIAGPWLIRQLQRAQCCEQVVDVRVGALNRAAKVGTPTMGGLLILFAALASTFLWAEPGNFYVILAGSTFAFMGALGFVDDLLKLRRRCGLSSRMKLLWQAGWVIVFVGLLRLNPEAWERSRQMMVPFLKEPLIGSMGFGGVLGFLFLIFAGSTNAVNLTDGLDGLAVGCSSTAVAAYWVLAYVAGHYSFASYLHIPFVKGGGELAVFCGALFGACLGFLWFNSHPAQLFMGDTGSLAIGGALAAVAILIKQELVLIPVGGVFVIEALSVLIQVAGFKLTRRIMGTGRRLFFIAPLHHHVEQVMKNSGEQVSQENRIVVRFGILSILFALLGLATLKIR